MKIKKEDFEVIVAEVHSLRADVNNLLQNATFYNKHICDLVQHIRMLHDFLGVEEKNYPSKKVLEKKKD